MKVKSLVKKYANHCYFSRINQGESIFYIFSYITFLEVRKNNKNYILRCYTLIYITVMVTGCLSAEDSSWHQNTM